MLKDMRLFRRNSSMIPSSDGNNENLPADPSDSSTIQLGSNPSRPPLNTIQEPQQNPTSILEQEAILRRKVERTTPSTHHLPIRTPERPMPARNKFGWVPKSDRDTGSEPGEDSIHQGLPHLKPLSRSSSLGNGGGYGISTPRTYRTAGKASSVHSDCSSTHSTPTKSVTKPGFGSSRPPLSLVPRTPNFSLASKGTPMPLAPSSISNVAEFTHFELREDPSFWMDHNIQVVIRARPLNSMERSLQGYSRCLKQESAQSVVWIGQPEARFTFDYVACETISQEMLFRVAGLPMVENCMSGYNSCMFAYGQTGSGKTYTMLGEISELEIRPSTERGMTPRIFEFLFARIRAEEESRRDEKLKYNCKCSFLEIYNEQITDLLEPSSNNLLLREDLRKGVYVDNLTEYEVETVNDILKLLIQGAANRKVAATNMNRESSRSHSVFTCVIESRWEKDSTSNLRFARLNLVDLAGSERQKTSGAEGERLKEAANINKSLSTLGHVIMVLADVANGKQRHVPYRDSRLTFLLQDSLGGNSKTIIMANVSPSICSASETLSTLKFAQRAKVIQNNAVVNEDASGDIIAFQHQIHLLKEELAVLKRQNISRSLSFRTAILVDDKHEGCDVPDSEKMHRTVHMCGDDFRKDEASCSVRVSTKQLKSLEATLAGALRRDKMADITIKQLEAEIEHLNRLVRQREDDTQSCKMKLKFREDKIQRMESLLDDLMPTDSYLREENTALSEEIQLLLTKVDRNPEVTRFALENIRLLDQLRRFQDFYEEGERELLLTEVSELRNQLIQFLDEMTEKDQCPKDDMSFQLNKTSQELEDCRNNLKSCLETNAKLNRDISLLRSEINNIQSSSDHQHINVEPHNMEFHLALRQIESQDQEMNMDCTSEYEMKHTEAILNLQLELDIFKTMLGEEKASRVEVEERALHVNHELEVASGTVLKISKQSEDLKNELKDARSVIEALESQHILLLNELEELRTNNSKTAEVLKKQDQEEISIVRKQVTFPHEELKHQPLKLVGNEDSPLQMKVKRIMQASLDKACSLSMRCQSQASQISIEQEMDEACRQVEAETAEVIVCLQEELMSLQQRIDDSNRIELLSKQTLVALETEVNKLNERLCSVTQENKRLCVLFEEKEQDLRSLSEEWERLAYDIADVLADGNLALEDASDQVASISDSFPHRSWITEQVDRMVRCISERDSGIEELQKCLEDAQNAKCDMEWKLSSLRGATLAITEAQQQEISDKESDILLLTSRLSERDVVITELERRIELGELQTRKAEICATVAFMTLNRLAELNKSHLEELENAKIKLVEFTDESLQNNSLLQNHISSHNDAVNQIQALKLQLEQCQEHIDQLKSAKDEEQALGTEHQKQKEDEAACLSRITGDILQAKRVVNNIKIGVSTLHSCMNEKYCDNEDLTEVISSQTDVDYKQHNVETVPGCTMETPTGNNTDLLDGSSMLEVAFDREKMIFLLRQELESALDSLKEVQAQMVKLVNEKEDMKKSEIQSRKSIKQLSLEVLQLKSDICNKEQQLEFKLQQLDHKLQMVEVNAKSSNSRWQKNKEVFEIEIRDLKNAAAQKSSEASNLVKKIEEAQETMRDADITVNALVEANGTAKLEIERYQKHEITLNNEKKCLYSKLQTMQSSLDTKEQEYEFMKKNFQLNLTEASSLVLELEDTFKHLEVIFTEKFELISRDCDWFKHQFHQYTELARTWLEETWSEIIGKDCAVSVLHLCHVGIFLERITGLNAENGFLYHGLCDSNTLIADLREHNDRAKKDLEMCSLLKGKLLSDINHSFNRITKKEDETTKFKSKLTSFEKKIQSLQSQEESMLARSNSMGAELAILMKELDANNRNALTATSVKERLLKENDELHKQLTETTMLLDEEKVLNEIFRDSIFELGFVLKSDSYSFFEVERMKSGNIKKFIECHSETVMTSLVEKDVELLVLASELKQKIWCLNQMDSHIADLERQRVTFDNATERLKEEIVLHKLDSELKNSEASSLLGKNKNLKAELLHLKIDHSKTMGDLQDAKLGLASSHNNINVISQDNIRLEAMIRSLESCITSLKYDLDMKNTELERVVCSHASISKEFDLKDEVTEMHVGRINALEAENDNLRNELMAIIQMKDEIISMISLKLKHSSSLAQSANLSVDRLFHSTEDKIVLLVDAINREFSEQKQMVSKFVDDLEDSASIAELQRVHVEEMTAKLNALGDELASKSCELVEAIVNGQVLEAKLLEANKNIYALELNISEKHATLNLVRTENLNLKTNMEQLMELKGGIEHEFMEKLGDAERLEEEMLVISASLGQNNQCLENLQNDMAKVERERANLESVVFDLKEQLEMAHTLAEENEAIATEAQQIAESSKVHAENKEEEVRLLESSVEELESTVNVLENKVEVIKGEAEKQRVQREEVEIELEAVRSQMLTHASGNMWNLSEGWKIDFSRQLQEKLTDLQEAQKYIQFLQKEVADKETEIDQFKAHISELNMHADAQAREYQQKFKELEAMAQQVRTEPAHSSATSMTTTKAEKGATKSRGSGSPFKCIGLGLTQQINSEKDEELTTARRQIDELEDLAVRRQKEIFMLNARLAATESMTHDAIRDLLGVKLDMTNYATLLDHQQVKEITRFDSKESGEKEREVSRLKEQLNEFIEERQSWLDEISQRHTEMVAARFMSEKLRQQEQTLFTENEILKADNSKYKKIMMELEDKVKELSDQQNLQHRIHHHAKTKEENSFLRLQNEELNVKLERSEVILSRVKEELARYRASSGKRPYVDIDEEEHLRKRLEDSEEERMQLAQKLLNLCSGILKVAGLSYNSSNISPLEAEDALDQLKDRINALESELQDLKLQCKVSCEKIRLCELKQWQLSLSDDDCSSSSTS